MDAGFDARLRADDVSFGAEDAALLRAVDEVGSLNRAADELGRSYSRAHDRLTDLEDAFGTLVERQRGGSGGGGSSLTDTARDLLARFDRLRAGYTSVAETTEAVLDGRVVSRDGELGTVETGAGRVRALVPPGVDTVQVSLRADAVTLHDPDETPAESATSARNRFVGEVVDVERGEAVSRVRVDVGTDAPLYALVTDESRDRLTLEAGRQVVASFKATATRATPRSE
ncbi:TOBE domain-containing protein [Halospeciosus flavus]|uniref:TOBE domain-containing protein n=1 Tax=Halospeciosus flavus TaxID=3032283 RepID=A0ABD5Z861_9EURY|nr:TOBE domain-containing protein [Halospeciosus flavus]